MTPQRIAHLKDCVLRGYNPQKKLGAFLSKMELEFLLDNALSPKLGPVWIVAIMSSLDLENGKTKYTQSLYHHHGEPTENEAVGAAVMEIREKRPGSAILTVAAVDISKLIEKT